MELRYKITWTQVIEEAGASKKLYGHANCSFYVPDLQSALAAIDDLESDSRAEAIKLSVTKPK